MANRRYLLGLDIGSSAVKAALVCAESGETVFRSSSPKSELEILAPRFGWAEQHPDTWWEHACICISELKKQHGRDLDVCAIGISYQMHGLVTLDANYQPVRPAIIWCDSRAVEVGEETFNTIGQERCLNSLLNSPGNFTASKLAWVKQNEPANYSRIKHVCLPGDYIALKLTGELVTSESGLSEGILWDFSREKRADYLISYFGFDSSLFPEAKPCFSITGNVRDEICKELGIAPGAVVSYRAGDQPNNAFSLKVLEPGEVAATAGTSGVVYGVTGARAVDSKSRVNTFLHVTNAPGEPRFGVLLCVNGTGSLNRWLKNEWGADYNVMNMDAFGSPIGSRGVSFVPYGNGAERTLNNRIPGAALMGLDLNKHGRADVFRAAQEGIAYALRYGFDGLSAAGVAPKTIRAGRANMFLSPVFREAFTNVVNTPLELYETDGAEGAARGAGLGAGNYSSYSECFANLKMLDAIEPKPQLVERYGESYSLWLSRLNSILEN